MMIKKINHDVYIPYLDGWRGLAIICVLYSHFIPFGNSKWLGAFGVDLFFALSGYLMCSVLFFKRQKLSIFFIRRFSRVYPVFIIYVIIAYIIAQLYTDSHNNISLTEVFSTLVFMRSYFPSEPSIWATQWSIGHIWSLNIEEHSYIALAIVASITKGKNLSYALTLIGILIITSFIFRFFYVYDIIETQADFTLYSHVAVYAVFTPVFLRIINKCGYDLIFTKKLKTLLSVSCFILALLATSPIVGKPILTPILLGISINYFNYSPNIVQNILSNIIFRVFGKAAFSLYIWQQIFYQNVDNSTVGLCLALITGFMSYLFFENPIREFINRKYGTSSN